MTPLSSAGWHARFLQQAGWSRDLRKYLYERVGITSARRVVDLGCGTGVLAAELPEFTTAAVHGLDIDWGYLPLAAVHAPGAHLVQGDGHLLPYASESFDVSLCHFVLLWVAGPARVLAEMARVTRPGGAVLALSEPDYGGRIDYPPELARIGEWQAEALRLQGADPHIGRRLAQLFAQAGLNAVEWGVLGAQRQGPPTQAEWESEWAVIEADLKEIPAAHKEGTAGDLAELKQLDAAAWAQGERVLYVPTFYALGYAP